MKALTYGKNPRKQNIFACTNMNLLMPQAVSAAPLRGAPVRSFPAKPAASCRSNFKPLAVQTSKPAASSQQNIFTYLFLFLFLSIFFISIFIILFIFLKYVLFSVIYLFLVHRCIVFYSYMQKDLFHLF
jgi:hypothetical protein